MSWTDGDALFARCEAARQTARRRLAESAELLRRAELTLAASADLLCQAEIAVTLSSSRRLLQECRRVREAVDPSAARQPC